MACKRRRGRFWAAGKCQSRLFSQNDVDSVNSNQKDIEDSQEDETRRERVGCLDHRETTKRQLRGDWWTSKGLGRGRQLQDGPRSGLALVTAYFTRSRGEFRLILH